MAVGWEISVGIAGRYGLDSPETESQWGGGSRFSALVQTRFVAQPASYTIRTGHFPGVKRPKHGVDHLPPSSADVKDRVQLYFSPSGPSWPVLRWALTHHG